MPAAKIKALFSFAMWLFSAAAAFAADSTEDIRLRIGAGDPEAGRSKIGICKVCHSVDGTGKQENYPNLAGQYAEYILKQLHDFRSGTRKDPMMSAMVQSAGNEQDLADIAAYYASLEQMDGGHWFSSREGKKLFEDAEKGCVNCHGDNGKGIALDQPHGPVIGGQHKVYLVKQLKDFREGRRTNDPSGVMAHLAATMSDDEIELLSRYISGL